MQYPQARLFDEVVTKQIELNHCREASSNLNKSTIVTTTQDDRSYLIDYERDYNS